MILLAQVVQVSVIFTPCHPWCVILSDFTFLPFYFDLSFPVFFHSSDLMHPDLHTDLDNLDSVQHNLRHSAKGSLDAYDVTFSLTGYEPNDTVSNNLVDSQGSFSYITPLSDLDIDDTTLGKLLTEAHREYADYRSPEGVSVSQSSLSVVFDRTGKLVGERNVDQSVGFGVTRNTYSAHSKFSENTQAEKVVDRSGKPEERKSSNVQIRTLLEEQRQMIIAEYCEKIGHHELQAAIGISWRSSTKSYRDEGITKIPKFYLRYDRKTEAHRGPEHYYRIIRKITRISKWSKLYERF